VQGHDRHPDWKRVRNSVPGRAPGFPDDVGDDLPQGSRCWQNKDHFVTRLGCGTGERVVPLPSEIPTDTAEHEELLTAQIPSAFERTTNIAVKCWRPFAQYAEWFGATVHLRGTGATTGTVHVARGGICTLRVDRTKRILTYGLPGSNVMKRRLRWIGMTLAGGIAAATALTTISPSTAAEEVRLTAAGDYGARATTASVLTLIASISPDAHLALGDLAYGDSSDEYAWCSFVKQRVGEGFPFQLVAGNHESTDWPAHGAINNYSACLPNQIAGAVGTYGREYYMDFPKTAPLVRVIQASPFISFPGGHWPYVQGDSHFNWLASAIDDGRARGAKWIIVTSHIPCLIVGTYNCPSPRDFYDLLVTKRVDLVLHGHEHYYSRTHQLRSGVTNCATVTAGSFNAACVADNDSDFIAGQGSVFATIGTGGIPLRNVAPTVPTRVTSRHGPGWTPTRPTGCSTSGSATNNSLASFVRATGGDFTDTFTITKGEPPESTSTSTPGDILHDLHKLDILADADVLDVLDVLDVVDVSTTTTSPTTTSTTSTTTATTQPPDSAVASDSFTRSIGTGWGTADVGGPWTVSTSSAFSVNGTAGRITLPAGGVRSAHLRSATSSNTDVLVTLSSDKIATGSGLYTSIVARAVVGAAEYRADLRMRPDGRLSLRLGRNYETIAPEVLLPAITYAANVPLNMRVQAIGTSPTTIRAKAWRTGTAEPSSWAVSTTDNTASMQSAGSVGLNVVLSSSASNAPITLSVDDLLVTTP
jgi:3',5'-cyclic AMP phosphodiesterase CpdA